MSCTDERANGEPDHPDGPGKQKPPQTRGLSNYTEKQPPPKYPGTIRQGLFKVLDRGPLPRTAIPAQAGIQSIANIRTSWIPAFGRMTD